MGADADTGTGTSRWMRYVESLRTVHGLTQGQFMSRIGYTTSTWTRWSQGQTSIRPDTALAIARQFRVPLPEVQMAAGYGTPDDYNWDTSHVSREFRIAELSNRELLELLASRLPDDPAPDEKPENPAPPAPDVKRRKTRDDDE